MAIDILRHKTTRSYRVRVALPSGRRISKCFERKVDAVEFQAKVIADSKRYEKKEAKRILFQDFADLFFKNHCMTLEFSSQQKYEGLLRLKLKPRFEDRWLDSITTFDIVEFAAEIKASGASDSMKYFLFSTFKSVLRKGFEWGYIESIPGAGVKAPRKAKSRIEFWSKEEVSQFLYAIQASPRLPLYLIALNTGLRLGEILGLKKDAVNFSRNILVIKRGYCQKLKIIKETTKTHKDRFLVMNEVTRNSLLELVKLSPTDGLFSPKLLGCNDMSHMARVFRQDALEAQVRPIHFHDLRHTFATQFVSNGGSIFHLANILGHSTTAMTARYAHFCIDQAKEVSEVVSFGLPKPANVISISNGNGQQVVINKKVSY